MVGQGKWLRIQTEQVCSESNGSPKGKGSVGIPGGMYLGYSNNERCTELRDLRVKERLTDGAGDA